MGMGVVVPMRMTVVMRMAMGMVVMMGVGRGGNHFGTLYYNITPVHDPAVIPGRRSRARNLEIPGSMPRIAPE